CESFLSPSLELLPRSPSRFLLRAMDTACPAAASLQPSVFPALRRETRFAEPCRKHAAGSDIRVERKACVGEPGLSPTSFVPQAPDRRNPGSPAPARTAACPLRTATRRFANPC